MDAGESLAFLLLVLALIVAFRISKKFGTLMLIMVLSIWVIMASASNSVQ